MPSFGLPGNPNEVGGAWGAGMYPEWYQSQIEASGMNPEQAATEFLNNYVRQNPDMDFGWYWNSFLEGGENANIRNFGEQQPADTPTNDRPSRFGSGGEGWFLEPPPRPSAPPAGQNPNGRYVLRGNRNHGFQWQWEAREVRTRPTPPPAPPPPAGGGLQVPPVPPVPPVVPPVPPVPPNDNGGWTNQAQQFNGGQNLSASARQSNRPLGGFRQQQPRPQLGNQQQDPNVNNVANAFGGRPRTSIPRLLGQ